ncbi:hypothetical protein HC031_15750 [Planosporangium thailandense]|uniref:Lipoprotein n=1 Tax=Planosporangium thailandense TaxID=765197 RepID=A0ABX0Y125_9ACTN|nr:hypothetical protein [Planosporangium thailandense]NJC71154.1 hypothetical protein [Planosporangium thailandense]
MNPSRLAATAALACAFALTGCSNSGASPQSAAQPARSGGPSSAHPGSSTTAADPARQDCTGGLAANAPGVVRITCDGSATIHVRAGEVTKDFHGGACQSVGDVWSAAAGVVIDSTGAHGTYTGPPVDSIVVNNTDTAGKGTVQAVLSGRHYYNLGDAAMTVAPGGKSAHIEGTSHPLSDAPGAKITVDVTC